MLHFCNIKFAFNTVWFVWYTGDNNDHIFYRHIQCLTRWAGQIINDNISKLYGTGGSTSFSIRYWNILCPGSQNSKLGLYVVLKHMLGTTYIHTSPHNIRLHHKTLHQENSYVLWLMYYLNNIYQHSACLCTIYSQ